MSIALIMTAVLGSGQLAMWAILAVGLCNSIMFPTIFSMALHKLGPATGQGSGLLCMAIVGGAILPFAQGLMADVAGLQLSFLVPAVCYVFILYYGVKYAGMYGASR
jgi:MFS transporter, FHS family, L-fucose permease